MAPLEPADQTAADMAAAREAATFDPLALNRLINAGSRDAFLRQKVLDIAKNEPSFTKKDRAYLSRKERLHRGVNNARRLLELTDEHGLDYDGFMELMLAVDEGNGLNLHEIAFAPVLRTQMTDEQQAEWVHKAENHEIIGCYAQTELAHGSNVQKLETTATYVVESEEFEIHSPSVTATKWWMGGLGLLATHAVVQARLILSGKDYGPHLFLCQLRDMNTHAVLAGREIGEIGPKVFGGMSGVDNGYVRFDRVRVPRKNMLARFAQVSKDGKYHKPPHDRLSYTGMLYIRSTMIGGCGWGLAKAATITSRYCTVRRQFGDAGAGDAAEKQVIYYPSTYMRIVPLVAKAWAFITLGKDVTSLFSTMAEQLAKGETGLVAEVHAVLAGLKAYCTTQTTEGCETARRAMGGHGFLEAGGIGRIYALQLPGCTYEGDNYILNLQVCRAALKSLAGVRSNPSAAKSLPPSSAYLSVIANAPSIPALDSSAAWSSASSQQALVDLRAAHHVQRLEGLAKSGKKWGELSWECQAASRAIVESFIVRRMSAAVDGGLLSQGVAEAEKRVVKDLITFHNLHLIAEASGDLFEFNLLPRSTSRAFSASQPIEVLRATTDSLALSLVPQLIGLTDAFGFDDWDLDSALGKSDGRVYEDLLRRAREEARFNVGDEKEKQELFRTAIKPILDRGRRLSSARSKL